MNKFIYSLRIGISPTFNTDLNIKKLIKFCKNAHIDDIQFIINMEELNTGHLTTEENKVWLDMVTKYKKEIEIENISVSLNPWTTTLHTDRGRVLKEGQNFTTMVDYKGNSAKAVACPLDSNFTQYISNIYKEYAKIDFNTIWIEDDFRLHNHSPLQWGGCFCEKHMELFSKLANKKLDRDTFISDVLKPGSVNKMRDIYLQGNKITMENFAKLLSKSIYSVNENARIGLMTSDPSNHCIENRDWDEIFRILKNKKNVICRPHFPAYNEICGIQFCKDFNKISRLTQFNLPKNVLIWPELDNMPHSCFSKSHKFQQFEIECSLSLCADGITINIFDLTGNGINEYQKNDRYLSKIKPYIQGVKNLNIKREEERGINVLFSHNACSNIHSNNSANPSAIKPDETFFAQYFSSFGISNKYSESIDFKNKIVAISNQYLRNLNNNEIIILFENNKIILDANSVEILIERNLGYLINAKNCKWHSLNNGDTSYEEVIDNKIYQGLEKARMSTQALHQTIDSGDYLEIEYTSKQIIKHSIVKNYKDEVVGLGFTEVNNCIIFPFGNMNKECYFLYNPVRKELFEKVFKEIPFVKKSYYVSLNYYEQENRKILLLTNFSNDDFDDLQLNIPFKYSTMKEIDRETGIEKKVTKINILALSTTCLIFD